MRLKALWGNLPPSSAAMISPSTTVLPASPSDHRLWAREMTGVSSFQAMRQHWVGNSTVHQFYDPVSTGSSDAG